MFHLAPPTSCPCQLAFNMADLQKPVHYDTISIGSGEGGKYVCWDRASHGYKTAVIEHRWYGGSCPNIACLPSKNLLYSAEQLHNARDFAASGLLKVSGEIGVHIGKVRERKRQMVNELAEMHKGVFKATGAEMILGHARLLDEHTVQVDLDDGGKTTLTADHIVLCTGSRAQVGDIPGLNEATPLTHVELLELDEVPSHLIIVGGGYSGIEFAQAWRRFGAEVTVLERSDSILKNEDRDVVDALLGLLGEEGVRFHTKTCITSVTGRSGRAVMLSGTQAAKPFKVEGSHILVAAGRTPNTENCGLEIAGIELTPKGHVKVNKYLQTNLDSVFAVGDCADSPHFTHMGFDDFRIVRDFLAKSIPLRSTSDRQVPYALYTSPELAHVGLSETAARMAGVKYRITKIPMAAFLRTRTMDASQGFAKALVSVEDDTIVGFTALGHKAGELLPVVQLAMSEKLPYTRLSGLIVTHPTMNEGLVSLFGAVPPRA